MKMKRHSGAKKRLRARPGGTVKRRQARLRHILSNKSSKRKRHLGRRLNVNPSDMDRISEQLLISRS